MTQLNQFISTLKQNGIMRTSHFEVMFGLPPVLSGSSQFTYNNLSNILMFCESTALPGLNISSTPARTYGEIREMPYERMYGDILLTFYVDNSMLVKRLFDQWSNESIQDSVTRDMNYYFDYVTDIDIHVLDIGANMRYTVTLHECWPKLIGQIEMNNASKDYMRLPISMNYKYWTSTQNDVVIEEERSNSILSRAKRFITVPDKYYTDFNAFQAGINSFENVRTSLFATETQPTGNGTPIT